MEANQVLNDSVNKEVEQAEVKQPELNSSSIDKWNIGKYIILPDSDESVSFFAILEKEKENLTSSDIYAYAYMTESGMIDIFSSKELQDKVMNIKLAETGIEKKLILKNLKSIFNEESTNLKPFSLPEDVETELLNNLVANNKMLNDSIKKLSKKHNSIDFLNKYAFKKHVLIQGKKGSSKSYSSFQFIADGNYEHEVLIGHNSIEAMDFLGHFITTSDGSIAWKDGALTSAFRKAKEHGKAILLIDEMLRIPEKELNVIVGSLSPDYNGDFVLRTGRAIGIDDDGLAKEEVLKVPKDSLFVIATTNVGAGYQIYHADEALLDRFRILNINMTEKEIAKIIEGEIKKKRFSSLVKAKLLNVFSALEKSFKLGELTKMTNLRQLVESIEMADTENDIESNLYDLAGNMVEIDLDGKPNKQQLSTYQNIIKNNYN
jgi:hypothetical protein